jgi:acetyl esterase/lipase
MLTGVVSIVLLLMGEYRADIEYGRVGGQSLRMDARVPDGAGPFPAAIIVHGGAWVGRDRKTTVQPLFQPLTEDGFAWFSISYRLANARNGSLAGAVVSAMA